MKMPKKFMLIFGLLLLSPRLALACFPSPETSILIKHNGGITHAFGEMSVCLSAITLALRIVRGNWLAIGTLALFLGLGVLIYESGFWYYHWQDGSCGATAAGMSELNTDLVGCLLVWQMFLLVRPQFQRLENTFFRFK